MNEDTKKAACQNYPNTPIWVCSADAIFDIKCVRSFQLLDSGVVLIELIDKSFIRTRPIKAFGQGIGDREFNPRHMGIGVGKIPVCRRAKYTTENAYLRPRAFLIFDRKGNVKICPTDHFA